MVEPDIPGENDPGPGRRLGVDVGTARIGVAYSDRMATLAMPLETVCRETGLKDRDKGDIDRLIELIEENEIVEVVVGLPRDLKGNGSVSVKHAKEIAFRINRRMGGNFPVRMADERLTTVAAMNSLHAAGRTTKNSRHIIDQVAAVEILQTWLDTRNTNLAKG
ncbi:Holliday junction resolvase RuvX [Corynebacterium epidermidicanis]|uniref:Putative pre-16S rRNA nuclease n=1 Tax=Corynebacterium epidermidicanis TaxID=1050174 RepID=A0A0G3GUQ7_9CORY|nr:Holliday junction resolvase RuvX [Corynebacterium epidermidicanis]AKK03253.1 RNAse H-fold protein [Corynebacterium epidermidicanis]